MNYSKLLTNSLLIVSSLGLTTVAAFAELAPVSNTYQYEDTSNNNNSNDTQQSLSVDQRLNQLQQQAANQKRLNIPAQIQQLQQQVQDLTGKVQVQAHELAELQQKVHSDQMNSDSAAAKSIPKSIQVTVPTANSQNVLSDQDAYESAYKMILQKNFQAALIGMQNYLKQYPDGSLVSNAHYWLGEIYLIQNNERMAVSEFETVISQYPKSDKVSDAMLKLGFVYYDNGQLNKSKIQLTQVVKQYPNTTVAKLAQSRLRDIAQHINASQLNQTPS
jgi:tol-pal system protein YbgF